MDIFRSHILICRGTGCTSWIGPSSRCFDKYIKEEGLEQEVKVVERAAWAMRGGPNRCCVSEGAFTAGLRKGCTGDRKEHLVKGRVVKRLLTRILDKDRIKSLNEVEFYKNR